MSMVAWFGSLIYLSQLFVYHNTALKADVNSASLTEPFHNMEKRLYKFIANPAMLITWVCGLAMLYFNGTEWLGDNPWMHAKLTLVFILTGVHHMSPRMIRQLKAGKHNESDTKIRMIGMIPALILVATVLLAVYKNAVNFAYTFGGVLIFALLLFLFVKTTKRKPLNT